MRKYAFVFMLALISFFGFSCATSGGEPSFDAPAFQFIDPIPKGKAVIYFYHAYSDSERVPGPGLPSKKQAKDPESTMKIAIALGAFDYGNLFDPRNSKASDALNGKNTGVGQLVPGVTLAYVIDPVDTVFDFSYQYYSARGYKYYSSDSIKIKDLKAGDVRYFQISYDSRSNSMDIDMPIKTDRLLEKMQAGWIAYPSGQSADGTVQVTAKSQESTSSKQ